MKHSDFKIGTLFRLEEQVFQCTDVGKRTVVAIRVDRVEIGFNKDGKQLASILTQAEAQAAGWFEGPPYAVAELVFDENDFEIC